MAILKTVKLQWNGVEYVVEVTMALISRIEEEVNLMRLALRLRTGDPPMSHVAIVFAHLLRAGGCMIGEGKARRVIETSDIWTGMFQDGAADRAVDVVSAATAALQCVFPDVKVKALEGADAKKENADPDARYPWEGLYRAAVGVHALAPSEYWRMCPHEVWIFIDAKTPEKRYGKMSQSDVEALYQLHEQLEASEDGKADS